MSPFDNYFDRIFVINLDRRADRWEEVSKELARVGIERHQRFTGYDKPVNHEGRAAGNFGCTASHRGLLELIAHNRWPRTLILEDDALFVGALAASQFSLAVSDIPETWDFLFLGGSYAENPKRRINERWIQTNGVMTTSSYGITWQMARKMAPYISGDVGIDSLYHKFQRENVSLMITPRLVVQRRSHSDIQERDCDNSMSMLDSRHEEMLLEGRWGEMLHGLRSFIGTIQRREIAAQHDMDGETVIVGDKLYRVVGLQLPKHKAPWYRNEAVTYLLEPCT